MQKHFPEEPACYGSIRLTEAASRLCKIICEKYPENDAYRALLGCIDADKGKALTEPEGFAKMLEKASEMLGGLSLTKAPEIPEITGISGAFSENKADI